MRVISVRNVHEALPTGLELLRKEGVLRQTRNGPALVYPTPVATVYERPCERVLFWPERDANPFFHLYESLWMLAGRNDLQPLLRYSKQMAEYSDDGETLHGAYGRRWRHDLPHGELMAGDKTDQIQTIINRLKADHWDRRSVLQMWDASYDLDEPTKDTPCNLVVTFQVQDQKLNMVVFCRSNDIVWGAYGANAVHFSMLQEHVAVEVGVEVGTYTQVSVNYHAYPETMPALKDYGPDPYLWGTGRSVPMPRGLGQAACHVLTQWADSMAGGHGLEGPQPWQDGGEWTQVFCTMMLAQAVWKDLAAPERFDRAVAVFDQAALGNVDWIVAGREWIERRRAKWEAKMGGTK